LHRSDERDGRDVVGLAALICLGGDVFPLLRLIDLRHDVERRRETGRGTPALRRAPFGCASRSARLRAIMSARIAMTFEIVGSDIVTPSADVCADVFGRTAPLIRSGHLLPSWTQVRFGSCPR
jgi:hypothetical protein